MKKEIFAAVALLIALASGGLFFTVIARTQIAANQKKVPATSDSETLQPAKPECVVFSGRVTDSQGRGVGGVRVNAYGDHCHTEGFPMTARTNTFGYYVLWANVCNTMMVVPQRHKAFDTFGPTFREYDVLPIDGPHRFEFEDVDFTAGN